MPQATGGRLIQSVPSGRYGAWDPQPESGNLSLLLQTRRLVGNALPSPLKNKFVSLYLHYVELPKLEKLELERKRVEELERQRVEELERQRAEELKRQRAEELERQRAEELRIDLGSARRHIDLSLIELAQRNLDMCHNHLTAAEGYLPHRTVAGHLHLFETYYSIDLGQPLAEADILISRAGHARVLLEEAKAIGHNVSAAASSALQFFLFYERYLERASLDPKRITHRGYRSFSVSNDDGLLQEIFRRIGVANPYFIEFGVHDGIQSNSTALLYRGCRGLRIEASSNYYILGSYHFRSFIETGQLRTAHRFLTAENINDAISQNVHRDVTEIDLLVVDVDGNDYWLWRAIDCINPRVVVVEYNSYLHPPLAMVQQYEPMAVFNGTSYYGASLEALAQLGNKKGYNLVGCSLVGDNAFFVRKDLCSDKFHSPFTAEEHYEPMRPIQFPWGHVPGFGNWQVVK
jgi:hypothetical protein